MRVGRVGIGVVECELYWSTCHQREPLIHTIPDGRTVVKQDSLALASMARDDPHASSTAAAMRGKVGSEFET